MNQCIVFFDIDGTLWDYQGKIPDSTVQAIRELRANGHYAFLCSGRSRVTIRAKELLDIGFDGIVAGCGTYIELNGDVIFEYKIPWEMLSKTISVMQECHLAAMYEGSKKLYVDEKAFGDDAYVADLRKSLGNDFLSVGKLTPGSIVNKLCIDYRNSSKETMIARLGQDYEIICHVFGPVAELLPKGFSKASGIKQVCSLLGIERCNTYAFGDSANDIDMLRYVQHGVAMGNASENTKQAADYVTASMYDDGIQKALKHFGLIYDNRIVL